MATASSINEPVLCREESDWTEQKTFEFASIADAVRDLRRSLHWKSFFDRVQIFGNELTLAKY